MKLLIDKSYCDDDFVKFLIRKLNAFIVSSLNIKKLSNAFEYLKSDEEYSDKIKSINTLVRFVYVGASSFKCTQHDDKYIIFMDDKKTLYNIKVYDICCLINYGNSVFDGYPIFTDNITTMESNLDNFRRYYNSLYSIGGI